MPPLIDLTHQTFGHLFVIAPNEKPRQRMHLEWLVKVKAWRWRKGASQIL
jgi:hypothetical protein